MELCTARGISNFTLIQPKHLASKHIHSVNCKTQFTLSQKQLRFYSELITGAGLRCRISSSLRSATSEDTSTETTQYESDEPESELDGRIVVEDTGLDEKKEDYDTQLNEMPQEGSLLDSLQSSKFLEDFDIKIDTPAVSLQSHFINPQPKLRVSITTWTKNSAVTICSSTPPKLVRDLRLDKHVVKQNKIRFVQKLKTLLLSKPKHFIPVQVLYKCRDYLSLPKPRSVLSMIRRYPTIFELFTIPTPPTPFHATGPLSQLCVRLTPAAAALAKKESDLKKSMALSLASKLQKLLMLASPYHRLLLSKLAHLGPDLGLPVNFRSRLCNDHPDKFNVVDTSYGRALELISWDPNLANALPYKEKPRELIVDRPLKFKLLKLRKGLNIKRRHHEYLLKFREVADVCPYNTNPLDLVKESIEAEKRACALVREVLGMTVEKRTLVDHLTHFRKEFGLPNKLRGMLVRHPEMFYVSLKGLRDSVFLVEGYSDKGALLEKDAILMIKDEMMKLVREGKRLRRERKNEYVYGNGSKNSDQILSSEIDDDDLYYECEDGLDDLFQLDDCSSEDDVEEDESDELTWREENGEFWTAETAPLLHNQNECGSEPW